MKVAGEVFVFVIDVVATTHHQVGGSLFGVVKVVGHHVPYVANLVFLSVVEVPHHKEVHVVAVEEVEEGVGFVLRHVGSGGGAVVVCGAEEAGVGGYHNVAVLFVALEQFLEPLGLAFAEGGVTAVEEYEEVLVPIQGTYLDAVGGGVEILLVVLLAVEVDVVVANHRKAGVLAGGGDVVVGAGAVGEAVENAVGALACLVGNVAVNHAEERHGVGVDLVQVGIEAGEIVVEVRVGAEEHAVVVGGVLNDVGAVLVVPSEPVGHAVFGVGSAGEEHTFYIQAVA